ncbi:beta-ketoacyl synthase N-terminal-like domain-containing protein [Streptomyces sp. 6N223]|uniref:beta-ketoacyl synthase N-terminal-like domain-containing protein n=1 Tax=Streptomyces sp. 6N223 TaxID=3457412 RepID=UPI003FD4EC3E
MTITGCGVLSAAGPGLAALAAALRDGGATAASEPAADPVGEFPPRPLRPVPAFDIRDYLGRKGTRKLDRFSTLGLAAARLALQGRGDGGEAVDAGDDETGVVLATSTGSLRSLTAVARDTLVQPKPYLVDPSAFPNTVMNSCAGQIAIWNGLRGLNATVAGGQVSSIAALRYARTALARGRARRLLVGGVEELTPAVAWGRHRVGGLLPDAALGEGGGFLVVEPSAYRPAERARGALAEVLAAEVAYYGGALNHRVSLADGLARCLERALARAGVDPARVDVVSAGSGHQVALRRIEERALARVLPAAGGRAVIRVADALGDCYSASGAMQLAALLAVWGDGDHPGGQRIGLVTSVGHDGNVGCAVVREARSADS